MSLVVGIFWNTYTLQGYSKATYMYVPVKDDLQDVCKPPVMVH